MGLYFQVRHTPRGFCYVQHYLAPGRRLILDPADLFSKPIRVLGQAFVHAYNGCPNHWRRCLGGVFSVLLFLNRV